VDEFLFDGFAFGVVADDATAAVSFEEEDLQLLLKPALTVDLDCPFLDSRAAGRGRGVVRWRSFDLSSTGWRRLTFVQSPISTSLAAF
jgi:hypothetical protein